MQINREFPGLARARNAEGAAAWFAPDAIVYVNGMPPVRGRDAIRAFYAGFFELMPIREMTFSTEEITQRGDIGVETGTSSLTIGPAGETGSATVGGKYLAVWKRQADGQWKLWRHSRSANSSVGTR